MASGRVIVWLYFYREGNDFIQLSLSPQQCLDTLDPLTTVLAISVHSHGQEEGNCTYSVYYKAQIVLHIVAHR